MEIVLPTGGTRKNQEQRKVKKERPKRSYSLSLFLALFTRASTPGWSYCSYRSRQFIYNFRGGRPSRFCDCDCWIGSKFLVFILPVSGVQAGNDTSVVLRDMDATSNYHISIMECGGTQHSTLHILLRLNNPQVFLPLAISPSNSIPPSFGNIHTKPYDQTGSNTEGKEEGEPFPIVPRVINDGLDNIWANHAGSPVWEAKQAKELV